MNFLFIPKVRGRSSPAAACRSGGYQSKKKPSQSGRVGDRNRVCATHTPASADNSTGRPTRSASTSRDRIRDLQNSVKRGKPRRRPAGATM